MVGAGRAQLDRELNSRSGSELIGVHPHSELMGDPGLQHRAALIGVEGSPLAERVDPAGVRRARRQHVAGDEVEVLGAVGARRDDMCPEERGLRRQLAPEAQGLLLVLDVETVSGLALERRDAGFEVLGSQARKVAAQAGLPRTSGGRDRRGDSSGGIRFTAHSSGEFGGTVAGEDEVRVRVDQTGDDRTSTEIHTLVGIRCRGAAADPGHQRAIQDHRGGADLAELPVGRRELTDAGEQRRAHPAVVLAAAFICFFHARTAARESASTTSATDRCDPVAP